MQREANRGMSGRQEYIHVPRGTSVATLGLHPEALLLNPVLSSSGPGSMGHVTSVLGPLSPIWKACRPAHFCGDITGENQPFPITLGIVPGAGRAEFWGS